MIIIKHVKYLIITYLNHLNVTNILYFIYISLKLNIRIKGILKFKKIKKVSNDILPNNILYVVNSKYMLKYVT